MVGIPMKIYNRGHLLDARTTQERWKRNGNLGRRAQ
jgi:hypothetical protein